MCSLVFGGALDDTLPQWLRSDARQFGETYPSVELPASLQQALSSARPRKAVQHEVFVIGRGKAGKSTVVNALLGQDASIRSRLPETLQVLVYVPRAEPKKVSIVRAAVQSGIHDWMQLRDGRDAPGLPGMRQYEVGNDDLRALLRGEAERGREADSAYPPAILEAYQEITNSHASLPAMTVVDTPGLDQAVPGDRAEAAVGLPDVRRAFRQWLSEEPRGRHVTSRYLGCAVLLCVVHGRRVDDQLTIAAMDELLQRAPKPVVVVMTHRDGLESADDTRRARDTLARHVSRFVRPDDVVAIDAKSALKAAETGDGKGREETGLGQLVERIRAAVTPAARPWRLPAQVYVDLRRAEATERARVRLRAPALPNRAISLRNRETHRRDLEVLIAELRERYCNAQAKYVWLTQQLPDETLRRLRGCGDSLPRLAAELEGLHAKADVELKILIQDVRALAHRIAALLRAVASLDGAAISRESGVSYEHVLATAGRRQQTPRSTLVPSLSKPPQLSEPPWWAFWENSPTQQAVGYVTGLAGEVALADTRLSQGLGAEIASVPGKLDEIDRALPRLSPEELQESRAAAQLASRPIMAPAFMNAVLRARRRFVGADPSQKEPGR